MTTPAKSAVAAAAALFAITSMSAFAADSPAGSNGRAIGAQDTIHCYGVNSCKGTADCATANNECKGQNDCKGHGFKAMTAGDCLAKDGVIGDLG